MAFVNQLIPPEEKEKIDFRRFESQNVRAVRETSMDKWTIDKDINCYLLFLQASGPEGPKYFGLYYNDTYFQFAAYYKIIPDLKRKSTLVWYANTGALWVFSEQWKSLWRNDIDRNYPGLLSVIAAALKVHGFVYRNEEFEHVIVKINEREE